MDRSGLEIEGIEFIAGGVELSLSDGRVLTDSSAIDRVMRELGYTPVVSDETGIGWLLPEPTLWQRIKAWFRGWSR